MSVQKCFFKLSSAAVAVGMCSAVHAATLIHAVGVDNSTAAKITSWEDLGVDGVAATETLTGVSGTVGAEIFTYDITVTIAGVAENLITVSAKDLLGRTNTGKTTDGFRNKEGFDLTISNISNANVQFDGFMVISHGNTTDGKEGATINETDYVRSGDTVETLDPVVTVNTLEWRSIAEDDNNGVSARYIEFQFSEVPEPSSLALMGLGGLLIARRRRDR